MTEIVGGHVRALDGSVGFVETETGYRCEIQGPKQTYVTDISLDGLDLTLEDVLNAVCFLTISEILAYLGIDEEEN